MTTSEHTPTDPTVPVVAVSAASVTDLFARALEGDDLADAEPGRRWSINTSPPGAILMKSPG